MKHDYRNKMVQISIMGMLCIFAFVVLIRNYRMSKAPFIEIENPLDIYTMSEQYIYFGRETCPSCRLAEKIILPILEKRNMSIYYFDTDKFRDHEVFESILHQFEIVEVPIVIKIMDSHHFESLKIMDEEKRIDPSKLEEFLK